MNAFHVFGVLVAAWALTLAFIGITREGFPRSKGVARAVGAISILLVAAAIFSAIYVGAREEEEEGEGGESAAAVLPL